MTHPLHSVGEQVRAALESARNRIRQEIKDYPRPVAGCDQQFNYLLEERMRIAQELAQLDEIRVQTDDESSIRRILDFVDSTQYIDHDAKEKIRAILSEGLPEFRN